MKTVDTPSILASKFNQFIRGLTTPVRALEFVFDKPGLLTLSLAPIFSAILFFSLMIYALMAGLWTFVHSSFLSAIGAYTGIAFLIAAALLLSALSVFTISILTFIITLFSSPFNDLLAEKTERDLGMKDVPHWSVGRVFRVFWIDIRKSVITIFTALVFSLGLLLPIANIFFFVGLALLSTFTFITYPQSRREQGIFQSLLWIKNHFFLSLGFGIVTLLLFSVPVFDFFALPISVVGGTLLFCESINPNRGPC